MMTETGRFWAKVQKTDNCWIWGASKNALGYGRFCNARRKIELAHRAAWRFANGEIPASLLVCHKCDNPCCVRPDHLFLGSSLDNSQDMISKGRAADMSGEKNGRAKLTDDQVEQIRRRYVPGEVRIVDLAKEYCVTFSHIWQIVDGKKRRRVEHNEFPEVK